jgi:putative FmdB family regulatory protein
MPLYDFKCTACDERFEAQVPYGELPKCPACGAGPTERQISPFAMGATVRPRGFAAKRSEGVRKVREEQRAERKAVRQEKRKNDG